MIFHGRFWYRSPFASLPGYILRREKIKTSRGGKCQAPEPAILTREAIQQFSGEFLVHRIDG